MATDFTAAAGLHAKRVGTMGWRRVFAALPLSLALTGPTQAAVGLAGTLPGKAILVVDGSTRTVAVGQRIREGMRLISVEGRRATIEVDGKRQILQVGQNVTAAAGPARTVLSATAEGHFVTMGQINGVPMRMLVDTGATMVSLGAGDARRLGLDLTNAQAGTVQTAAGPASAHRVRLDSVTVGGITMQGIDALVLGNDLPLVLLGMSFLSRTDMQREGQTLTIKQRY